MKEILPKYPSQPIETPLGIIPISINYKTGYQTDKDAKGSITEFFKIGDLIPQRNNAKSTLYGY